MPGTPTRPTQDWRVLVAVFWLTSMVESLGISQLFALGLDEPFVVGAVVLALGALVGAGRRVPAAAAA